MPLDVLAHARYTDRGQRVYQTLAGRSWVILLKTAVVLWIEHCNYCSSTREFLVGVSPSLASITSFAL